MVKVVSVWIKAPVTGWEEFTKEEYEKVSKMYTCVLELVSDVCICNGLDVSKVRLPATEMLGRCMKQSFFAKSKLQVEVPQMNQAEFEVRMVLGVC